MPRHTTGALRRLGVHGLLLISLLISGAPVDADPKDTEQRLKAAYLYNFSKFIEWPVDRFETTDSPFRICVISKRDFVRLLTPLQSRTIKTHPITIVELQSVSKKAECHILYLAKEKNIDLAEFLVKSQGQAILTVSDHTDFAQRGGCIGFLTHENRVRMEINLGAIHKAGLRVNAQLIEVSLRVFEGEKVQPEGSGP